MAKPAVPMAKPAAPLLRTAIIQRGREETARFSQALRNLDARGLRTPCSDDQISYLWLSELFNERRQATKWCRSCPVIVECRTAAVARREKWFVFGGIDFTKNPKARS